MKIIRNNFVAIQNRTALSVGNLNGNVLAIFRTESLLLQTPEREVSYVQFKGDIHFKCVWQ